MVYKMNEEAMKLYATGNTVTVCNKCLQSIGVEPCEPHTRKPCSPDTGFHKFKSKEGAK